MNTSQKLNLYHWEGINAQGMRVKGRSVALDNDGMLSELKQQAITPLKIKKRLFALTNLKIKNQHVVDFTQQLATLINSGIELTSALRILEKSQEHPKMRAVIFKLHQAIISGNTFSEILRQYPQLFDALYCNLIYIGEQSGTLAIILQQLAMYQEKISTLKQKIKKALIYPATVLSIALLIIILMFIFVVPQFKSMYQQFSTALPIYTQIIIWLSEKSKIFSGIFFSLITFGFALHKYGKNNITYLKKIDLVTLHFPLLGKIITKAILSRFSRTLAITFNAGLPLPEALRTIARSCGNSLFTQAISQLHDQVVAGQFIHAAMQSNSLFPQRMVQMLAIAEETGTLVLMLQNIADFYEQEVDQSVETFTKLLEPMLMIILGVIVGGIITAMYLPIFRLGNVI